MSDHTFRRDRGKNLVISLQLSEVQSRSEKGFKPEELHRYLLKTKVFRSCDMPLCFQFALIWKPQNKHGKKILLQVVVKKKKK